MNASPITKITSWFKFLGKNLRLVGCATVCAKSEVMLMLKDKLKYRALVERGVEERAEGGFSLPKFGESEKRTKIKLAIS